MSIIKDIYDNGFKNVENNINEKLKKLNEEKNVLFSIMLVNELKEQLIILINDHHIENKFFISFKSDYDDNDLVYYTQLFFHEDENVDEYNIENNINALSELFNNSVIFSDVGHNLLDNGIVSDNSFEIDPKNLNLDSILEKLISKDYVQELKSYPLFKKLDEQIKDSPSTPKRKI